MTTQERLIMMARTAAFHHKLDPALVCALVHHESAGWQPYASRYEKDFYARYIEKMDPVKTFGRFCSKDTEKVFRATSWGLMQIMGQTAREFGYMGEWLNELSDPQTNLEFGCRKLAKCFQLANGDREKALLKYNGGSEPKYPSFVLQYYDLYK